MTLDPNRGDPRHAPACPTCGDTGAVVVPLPACVDAGEMRLIPWPGSRSLRRMFARCDAPFGLDLRGAPIGCPTGAAHNRNLPRLSEYLRAVGVDTAAVLEAMEREFYETRGVFFPIIVKQ